MPVVPDVVNPSDLTVGEKGLPDSGQESYRLFSSLSVKWNIIWSVFVLIDWIEDIAAAAEVECQGWAGTGICYDNVLLTWWVESS